MYHTIPCEACVVHRNMNLASAELGALLHQFLNIAIFKQITWDRDRLTPFLVDLIGDLACLCTIHVRNDYLGTFISEQSCHFCSNALA